MYNQLYLQNIWLKFLINRIKIDRFRALRRGPETGAKTGSKTGAKNFPTDCYGEINKYEWTPSGFMKKMNEGLYRVTRFARDKNIGTLWFYPKNIKKKSLSGDWPTVQFWGTFLSRAKRVTLFERPLAYHVTSFVS